jgi:hypothetical protein
MVASCDTLPRFTTAADFISTLDPEIVKLFLEVLLVCDATNLIGKGRCLLSMVSTQGIVGHKMRPSMSRSGNCFDNAPMESFWEH